MASAKSKTAKVFIGSKLLKGKKGSFACSQAIHNKKASKKISLPILKVGTAQVVNF